MKTKQTNRPPSLQTHGLEDRGISLTRFQHFGIELLMHYN